MKRVLSMPRTGGILSASRSSVIATAQPAFSAINAGSALVSTTATTQVAPFSVDSRLYKQSSDDQKWVYTPEFESCLHKSLSIICERGNFEYAEVWAPSSDGKTLNCTTSWYTNKASATKISEFRKALESQHFTQQDKNVLTQAWAQKSPAQAIHKPTDPIYGVLVSSLNVISSIAFPIVHEGKVLAIQHFFSKSEAPLTADKAEELQRFSRGLISAGLAKTVKMSIEDRENEQMAHVYNAIVNEGVFNATTVYQEVDWFFNYLNLQAYYFERFPAAVIAKHIHSFIAAKKLAQTTGRPEDVYLALQQGESSAFYLTPDTHEMLTRAERKLERMIESVDTKEKAISLTYFRSGGTAIPNGTNHLGIFICDAHEYVQPGFQEHETDIWKVASGVFLRDKTPLVRERYQEVIKKAHGKLSPVFEVFPTYRDGTIPVMFCFKKGTSKSSSYLSSVTELIKHNNLTCERKFIESFSNGIVAYSFYFRPVEIDRINRFLNELSLLYVVPTQNELTQTFLNGSLTGEEYAYATSVGRCIYYFLNKPSEEFISLQVALKNDPATLNTLNTLQNKLRGDAVSIPRIFECLERNVEITKLLFTEFEERCKAPSGAALVGRPEIEKRIAKEVVKNLDRQILNAFHTFNNHLLKTNFYRQRKSSISYRLDPKFVTQVGYTEAPYGIIFVGGSEFHGFHIRFRDVARGGVRMIRSSSREVYNRNLQTLFSENYNLAYTQHKKNKDLPEFGSKGTILLNADAQQSSSLCFQKYCSGIIDLLIKDPAITDHYGKEELIFLGPDEGTADYMEWAALYAKKRGYAFWKAFTTGKPPSIGGIPHDTYGMTTRSVHANVLGCLEKKGLKEENVTKVQTGGPDGDLGSNEIILSNDRTIAIIDGSGVIYDPKGLNKQELLRLAGLRQMSENFEKSLLGPGGFKVTVNDRDVILPSGEVVENGMSFRNTFHLHPLLQADLFVPCGGRPESINLSNVHQLFNEDGTPRFKIIVEGANLFLTNDARLYLEKAGVVVYKDASTNKGGVLSSSLEVLAALSMNDEEFKKYMQVTDKQNPPNFYKAYVENIQQRIVENASLEFECIWKENENTKIPRTILTDKVSDTINSLNDQIQNSFLWNDLVLRKKVLSEAIPRTLLELLGYETVCQRVPESYIKALFGAYLASRFVYKFGISASELAFFEFMHEWTTKPEPKISKREF